MGFFFAQNLNNKPMKKKFFYLLMIIAVSPLSAQDNLGRLLASGVEDTRTFAADYFRPGAEASMYNLSSGWYQSAEVKGKLGFEFSIVGSGAVNLGEHQTFLMNTADYHNLEFADGSSEKEVASLLGHNLAPVEVYMTYDTPLGTERTSIMLPEGLAAAGVNFVPSAFLQARLGIFKGTEIKARYFPRVQYEDVEAELYGAGIQHEITSWLFPVDMPVAISGIVAYTRMNGSYDFTRQNYVEGENQRVKTEMDTWLFSGIVSTNLPVVNFYGGLGYVSGSSNTAMLGTYVVRDEQSGYKIAEVEDPFTLDDEIAGMKASLGVSLKMGFVKLHADYSFQEYETLSAGLHFGL